MPALLDMFSTGVMTKAVELMPRYYTFLADTFGRDGEVYEDEYMGTPISSLMKLEIFDDGTLTLKTYGNKDEDFDWEDEGDGSLSIVGLDDETSYLSVDEDGNLVVEEVDDTVYFKKVKKFTESEDDTKATKEKSTKEKATKEKETKEKTSKEESKVKTYIDSNDESEE